MSDEAPKPPLTAERLAKKRALEERRDAPCPNSPHGVHSDPDNTGQCIYCACPIDIIEGLDY
jgi:uncharacterized protein (DUF1499 family)